MKPLISVLNGPYQQHLFDYHGLEYIVPDGKAEQYKIKGFDEYNYLIDINRLFSNAASGDIIDRSESIRLPFNMHVQRPWKSVSNPLSIDKCFEIRVQELEKLGTINLFWSGGIDSTSVLIAFLKHATDLSKLRVLYSTFSVKENPNFYYLLKGNKDIELVEFSGDIYLNQKLDGIFVSADVADDLTASLDDSFYTKYGWNFLHSPWEDFFFTENKNKDFVNFCEKFNSLAGNPIKTVLEARWWFYTNCKIQKFPLGWSPILNDNQGFVQGFFDTYEFENFMYHDINNIIPKNDYRSYKQTLKDYIFDYNKDILYYRQKTKSNSLQLVYFNHKKAALKNTGYLLLLSNGTRVRTPNLPLVSEREYRNIYGNSLDYLFNTL